MKPFIKYGLILGLVSIVTSLGIQYTVGLTDPNAQNISVVILLIATGVCIYFSLNEQKEEQGYLKYGQGLGNGTLVGVVSALIGSIYLFVFSSYIYPEYLTDMKAAALAKALADPKMKDVPLEARQNIEMVFDKTFSLGSFLTIGILMSVGIAFVISLILAGIQSKKQEEEIVSSNFDPYTK